MRITCDRDELGRQVLAYEVEDYDGQPGGPALVVDCALNQELSPRNALAEALVFLGSASGPVTTQDPLAAPTAEMLANLSAFHGCTATNVNWKYADVPVGTLQIAVDEFSPGAVRETGAENPADFRLHLLQTSEFAGSLMALREGWVVTNASILGSASVPALDRLHRRLAILLLLSAELDAAGFLVPESWRCHGADWQSYRKLFKTVGLDLNCNEFPEDVDHD